MAEVVQYRSFERSYWSETRSGDRLAEKSWRTGNGTEIFVEPIQRFLYDEIARDYMATLDKEMTLVCHGGPE